MLKSSPYLLRGIVYRTGKGHPQAKILENKKMFFGCHQHFLDLFKQSRSLTFFPMVPVVTVMQRV